MVENYDPLSMHRLPFSRWHVLVIAALGIDWILDRPRDDDRGQ